MTPPARALVDRYRCSANFVNITLQDVVTPDSGFFRFGSNAICYGRSATGYRGSQVGPALYDVAADVQINESEVCLPFNPTEIIENLQLERYNAAESWVRTRAKKVYYHLRP